MKKYLYLTFAAVALFALGCGKGEFSPGPTLQIGDAPVITSPADLGTIVLTEDKAADTFAVSWTAADFGFKAAATYTVELDLAGNDFGNPVTLGISTGLSLNSTVAKLNTALFTTLGLPGEAASNIEMRLKVKIHPDVPEVYSPAISLTVTPYTIVIIYPKIYVPGNYQGWNPGNLNTVLFSAKDNDKYEGYIYFPDPNAEFKYTPGPNWDVDYGDNGANGTLELKGANIKLTDAGLYRLNVDLIALTHSNLKTNWGLIGDATPDGWNSDQDMSFNTAENKLSITLNLVPGKIKFRANDDWTVNLGDNDSNKSLEYGGADIAVAEAGNYTVDLILSGAVYTYKVTKN